jgi:hypothetical protein
MFAQIPTSHMQDAYSVKGIEVCKQHWNVVDSKPSKFHHPHHLQRWVGEHGWVGLMPPF